MDPAPAEPENALATPRVPCASDWLIACELSCIHCGYDLRMQRLDTNCPECGHPCTDAMGSLMAAALEEIGEARFGVLLMLSAAIFGPLFTALGVIDSRGLEGAACTGITCAVIGPVMATIGAFRLSAPISARSVAGAARWIEPRVERLRLCAVMYCACSVAAYIFAVSIMGVPSDARGVVLTVFVFAALLAWTGRNFFVSRRLASLMHRAQSPRTARAVGALGTISAAMFAVTATVGQVLLVCWIAGIDGNQVVYVFGGGGIRVSHLMEIALWVAVVCVLPAWLISWTTVLGVVAVRLTATMRRVRYRGPVLVARP